MSYLKDCLRRKLIFFTGKGGVGKSSLAWATALLCHRHGKSVGLVGWNPFDKESLEPPTQEIDRITIETLSAFREYALQILKFDKILDIVFKNHVFRTFIQAAPGLAETVAAGKVWDLYRKDAYDLLIVDLPSSGHAVSFFQSPKGVHSLFRTGFIHKDAERILEMFESESTRIDLVTLPEELPITECRQLKRELEGVLDFHLGYLHFNQATPKLKLPSADARRELNPRIEACLKMHEEEMSEDDNNMKEAEGLGLPLIRVNRVAEEQPADIIRSISNVLEAYGS